MKRLSILMLALIFTTLSPARAVAQSAENKNYLVEQAPGFTEYTFVLNGVAYQLGDKAEKLRQAGWQSERNAFCHFDDPVNDASQPSKYPMLALEHPDHPGISLMVSLDARALASSDPLADSFINRLHFIIREKPPKPFPWKLGGVIDQTWTPDSVKNNFPLVTIEDRDKEKAILFSYYCYWKNIDFAVLDWKDGYFRSGSVTFETTPLSK
jgi:hypothetical protein